MTLPDRKVSAIVSKLLEWFLKDARDLPWRRTLDPYGIWVSEIMLQQTQVKTVIPYWVRWMQELPTIADLAKAPAEKIHKLWEGLGYYTRVRNMQRAAQVVVEKHGGVFPQKFDEVLALPGIGRYTAGAICSIAFNEPTPIVDGNVIRVLARVCAIADDAREKPAQQKLWSLSGEMVALAAKENKTTDRPCSAFNQALMELGALICAPRQPSCLLCPVRQHCRAFAENRVAELPNLAKRVAITERRFIAFVVQREGNFLVRQRPEGVVNAHLWEFPNVEVAIGDTIRASDIAPFELKHDASALCSIKHSITRYRVTLEAHHATLSVKGKTVVEGRWLTLDELHALPFTSAHKKVLTKLSAQAV